MIKCSEVCNGGLMKCISSWPFTEIDIDLGRDIIKIMCCENCGTYCIYRHNINSNRFILEDGPYNPEYKGDMFK